MRHRLFEKWLFSQDDLDSYHQEILSNHIQTCLRCQSMQTAWNELAFNMDTKTWHSPDEGFAQRWQFKLKQYQILEQQKHAYWAFMLTAGGAFIFAIPFIWSVILSSPISEIWSAFYRITILVQYTKDLIFLLMTLVHPLGILIPSAVGLSLIFSAWSGLLLWLVVMRRVQCIRSRANDNT